MSTENLCNVQAVLLKTFDDEDIAAIQYSPPVPSMANLVIAGDIGIQQSFYRNFAAYAATRGFNTLTLDYRGIGLSQPTNLRGYKADLLTWAEMDLAAAVRFLSKDKKPLFLLGHGFGGQALGLLPNHLRIRAACGFGIGSGWIGWLPVKERAKANLMLHLLGPSASLLTGYFPGRRLGLRADLPIGVYKQWKKWSTSPNYMFDDAAMTVPGGRFKEIRAPIVAVNALDDRWAPPVSRDIFMGRYSNAPCTKVDVCPSSVGLKSLGHLGYFRHDARVLWDMALDWYSNYLVRVATTS